MTVQGKLIMRVKELFEKADPEMVFFAYLIINPDFLDFVNHSVEEKAGLYRGLKMIIKENCEKIASSEIDGEQASETIFILEKRRLKWGDGNKKDIDCFVIKDGDAIACVDKDFTMWNRDGDAVLDHFGIDYSSISKVASYNIAKSAVEHIGINGCCAGILSELFRLGFTEEDRQKKTEEIEKQLAQSEHDVKAGRVTPAEGVVDKILKKLDVKLTEDQKLHRRFEKEFAKNVREIEQRYTNKILEEDHQKYLNEVRREYLSRR